MGAPRIQRQPSIHVLRRELANRLDHYPVQTWPSSVITAVIGVLDGYGVWRESSLQASEVTRPFRLVQ